ncbi:phosphatase PAP2 family protein [Campylobacter sp. JMF_04 NA10]|uniref:phosphatase PAP2 family protein n=1 Tax=Campylobacter sp. JMF_04 NA10 TaxID=2983824 RepID=UPI0022E9A07B|nr:phosphatase PAP2 family protein [Campylobacter sp. JMF_04 NA10]MDA3076226.1 phosphatase PAP2 family protein [Campylobacter sp. JMF_04 NA10]
MKLTQIYKNILAHEVLWLTFFSILLLRLLFFGEYAFALFCVVCMCAIVYNISSKNRILRFGFYAVLMNLVFVLLKYISPPINPSGKKDALLYSVDCALFGDFIGFYMQEFTSRILTEIFAFFYLLFLPQLFYFFIYYLVKKPLTQKFYIGLMSLYAIGFLGYIFVPAIGPYDFLTFQTPLQGYFFFDLLNENYAKGSNLTDVFPSLHCGVSCFILLFNFKFDKKQFRIWLIPTLLLWVSTVYLHYHYLIDCIVGIMLATICFYCVKEKNEYIKI